VIEEVTPGLSSPDMLIKIISLFGICKIWFCFNMLWLVPIARTITLSSPEIHFRDFAVALSMKAGQADY